MNFSAPCIDSRRSTAALVGRDDGLLFFVADQSAPDHFADHAGHGAALGLGQGSYFLQVAVTAFAKAEIHQIFSSGLTGLGAGGGGLIGGHVSSTFVKNVREPMSQVNWEIFQAAVRITERYLPNPAHEPTQAQVADVVLAKLPNVYRALEAVALQIESENQRGLYKSLQK